MFGSYFRCLLDQLIDCIAGLKPFLLIRLHRLLWALQSWREYWFFILFSFHGYWSLALGCIKTRLSEMGLSWWADSVCCNCHGMDVNVLCSFVLGVCFHVRRVNERVMCRWMLAWFSQIILPAGNFLEVNLGSDEILPRWFHLWLSSSIRIICKLWLDFSVFLIWKLQLLLYVIVATYQSTLICRIVLRLIMMLRLAELSMVNCWCTKADIGHTFRWFSFIKRT